MRSITSQNNVVAQFIGRIYSLINQATTRRALSGATPAYGVAAERLRNTEVAAGFSLRSCERALKCATPILLALCLALCSEALAVPAEEGNFVTLGQTIEEDSGVTKIKDEMIDLLFQPDIPDVLGGQIKSGTAVRVLQKVELEGGDIYYQVSTFGRGGGMIGWVSEEYIYEILTDPQI